MFTLLLDCRCRLFRCLKIDPWCAFWFWCLMLDVRVTEQPYVSLWSHVLHLERWVCCCLNAVSSLLLCRISIHWQWLANCVRLASSSWPVTCESVTRRWWCMYKLQLWFRPFHWVTRERLRLVSCCLFQCYAACCLVTFTVHQSSSAQQCCPENENAMYNMTI